MSEKFEVRVSAGTMRPDCGVEVEMPHRWTEQGVAVESEFTGAHLLHLATAGCVLNDVYREARALDVPVAGVLVTAHGGFDTDTWVSTGITYRVRVDSEATAADVERLLTRVDEVAEIPRTLRAGVPSRRG